MEIIFGTMAATWPLIGTMSAFALLWRNPRKRRPGILLRVLLSLPFPILGWGALLVVTWIHLGSRRNNGPRSP